MKAYFLIGILILLALLLFALLLRAVKGPSIADRIVAVNMMGSITIVMIAIMSFLLKEDYLMDICLIYAMISFLAVTLLTKVYMGIYLENKAKKEEKKNDRA